MSERSRRRDADAALSRVGIERRRAFRWLLLPAAQWIVPAAWADAAPIASARLWPAQEYTRVIFEAKAPIEHQLVMLRDPDRLVLDLARIEPSLELSELPARVQPSDPYVAAIRVGNPSGGFLRVVVDLKSAVRPQAFSLPPVAARVQKARRVRADLFVSIHADAFTVPTARGSAVFALPEPGAPSAAARWMAQRENAADLI